MYKVVATKGGNSMVISGHEKREDALNYFKKIVNWGGYELLELKGEGETLSVWKTPLTNV